MPSDDVARLYDFTAGESIVSAEVDAEFNQAVTTLNTKSGRGVDNTFTGVNTFSGAVTISGATTLSNVSTFNGDTLSEKTSGAGVTVDGVLLKDGFIKPIPTTQPYTPAANGELGYDSTNHKYMVRVNGTNRAIIHEGNQSTPPSAATQAEQEAGSSTSVYTSPGTQHFHPSAAKAYCYWNQTGTQTIKDSYNITSITDAGVGRTTVTIATDLASANYVPVISFEEESADAGIRCVKVRNGTQAAGSIEIDCTSGAGLLTDMANVGLAIFGDLP